MSLCGFAVSSVYADTNTYNQGKYGQQTEVHEQNATKDLGERNAKMKQDSGKMHKKTKVKEQSELKNSNTKNANPKNLGKKTNQSAEKTVFDEEMN